MGLKKKMIYKKQGGQIETEHTCKNTLAYL